MTFVQECSCGGRGGLHHPGCWTEEHRAPIESADSTNLRLALLHIKTLLGACYKRDVGPSLGWEPLECRQDYVTAKRLAQKFLNELGVE